MEDLQKKIRHTYDIHQLLKENKVIDFFNSPAFDEMMLTVAQDDVASFKNNNRWLKHHPKEAMIFADTDNVWQKLKGTYNGQFKSLVFGEFPEDIKVLETLKLVSERLKSITWRVDFDNVD